MPNFWTQHFRPHASAQSYAPDVMAALYDFPEKVAGKAPTVDLLELGGGFNTSVLASWCARKGYQAPNISVVSIGGATNAYSGNPGGPDGEVMGDLSVVIGIMARAFPGQAANIRVLFCPNTAQGFEGGINAASNPLGISWGSAEENWSPSDLQGMNAALAKKINPVCVASGDNGSSDGESGNNLDFPGSSPYVLCCGGTSILTGMVNGVLTIANESVWNSGGGASGGGYSRVFATPTYQHGFVPSTATGRGGPDLAAAADPASAWDTAFGPIGGTSMVAPMMASFFAILNVILSNAGRPLAQGCPNSMLYANEAAFRDITAGNNGAYSATLGWDPASGLGAPDGMKIVQAYLGGSTPTPPAAAQPVKAIAGALYDGAGKMVYVPVTAA